MTSILTSIHRSQIVTEPFPHVHVPDLLDQDYYAALADAYPALQAVAGERTLKSNQAYLQSAREVINNPAIPHIWREFFAYHTSERFFREMIAFWQLCIEQEYQSLSGYLGKPVSDLTTAVREKSKEETAGNLGADVMLDCQFGMNSPASRPGTVRGPHIDKPRKLYAALLYFRHPDDSFEGGDLEFYRSRQPNYPVDGRLNINKKYVEHCATIPYRANSLVMWLNTPRSLHGVSPRPATNVPRRYINVLAESYTLNKEGFFPLHQPLVTRGLASLKRRLGFRDV